MDGLPGMNPGGNKVNAGHSKQKNSEAHDAFVRQAGISDLNYELVEI